jgi:uncharacterized membrane protein
MAKESWHTENGILSDELSASYQSGEISDAARYELADRARKLRILKYRLIFIFVALPFLLVAAIVFDWVWEMELAAHMTRAYVLSVYGGLIGLFILIFCAVGYLIRKRMQREEAEMLNATVPGAPLTSPAPIKPATPNPKDRRSRH